MDRKSIPAAAAGLHRTVLADIQSRSAGAALLAVTIWVRLRPLIPEHLLSQKTIHALAITGDVSTTDEAEAVQSWESPLIRSSSNRMLYSLRSMMDGFSGTSVLACSYDPGRRGRRDCSPRVQSLTTPVTLHSW